MKNVVSPVPSPKRDAPQYVFPPFWGRLEARILRFFSFRCARLPNYILALFFVWMGALQLLSPRAALQNSPLDFAAQVLSVASVGRISFVAAPHFAAFLEILCALCILCFASARLTGFVLFGRLIWAIAPLLMFRDDLWRTAWAPSSQGIGVVAFLVPIVWAQSIGVQTRWVLLASRPETSQWLQESETQIRARQLAWRRALIVGIPLLAVTSLGIKAIWPRYLVWFHARQEAAVLDEHLTGKLIKKSMPPSVLLGGRKITTWVYLPPGYDKSTQRYPVIYVMHGMPGEVRDCFVKGRVQDSADNLIKTHQASPFIIVGWDAQGPGGPSDVTNFLDRPGYPMESFITRELVPYIDRTYRTIPDAHDRALDGISAGGYGAANLLLKYPEIWKIGSSHNGFFSPDDDTENMTAILGAKSKKWAENDPTQLLKQRSATDSLHFYGDIGDGDDLQSEFVAFGKKLSARGIQNEMHIFPGRHTWEFWSQHFNNSFLFANKWFTSSPNHSL
ncbi:hypothetical protein EON83_04405 [bacterium]|nr:MAG: hypothetical protein EON83_04405 [bacterium]